MKNLLKNKPLIWLLVGYAVVQLSSLILKSHFTLILYELFYLAALLVAALWIVRMTKSENNLRTFGRVVLLFFLVNLTVFLVYIPTLLLNPSINWTLRGEEGTDPMILLVYFPLIHFAVAFFILGLTALVTWMVTEKRVKPVESTGVEKDDSALKSNPNS